MKTKNIHSRWVRALLLMLLVLFGTQLWAQKMLLSPAKNSFKPKRHPYTKQLRGPVEQRQVQEIKSKGKYEKLLVILIDFQEEIIDDPLSTGNGKFELEPNPDYLYSIGAPPHNQEYFEANLEAMRYYYLAVSAGAYNLEYDVWPKDKAAYTLPHSMSYYNPVGASSAEFVAKMEEYFTTSFETADSDDPELDFSAYAHYMIIHAGSDWQHDVLGDSPADLPSFFIRVPEEKKVLVDEGQTSIYHACNVPATISQDFSVTFEAGINIHAGYGALNSVMFHEFGHSLGLVDLYNVRNFYPMVGAFDIMDSGGSGILVDELENGDYVYVEGILPALPGAFSRALLFEDDFVSRGLMVEVSDLEPFSAVDLAASSYMQGPQTKPGIIRFPIGPNEYYLIENRSVDPDGDGGTAVFGALDGRVVLYPTAFDDDGNNPTYEYDYLLPSFIKTDNSAVGGGILVWHVNEEIVYNEGSVLEDGSFWSNFENNTVNTSFNRPGVSVLEADGLRDLGEANSMYWTGTPYEYFHARKPLLNENGNFINWLLEPWRPRLSSVTKPAMLATNGLGSMFYLDDISDPAPVMSFKLKAGIFEELFTESLLGYARAGSPINTNFSELAIPYYGAKGLSLYSYMNESWQDLFGPSPMQTERFDYPLLSVDSNSDGYEELVGVQDKGMYFMDFADVNIAKHSIDFPDSISRPLAADNAVYTHSENCLYKITGFKIEDFVSIPGIKRIAAFEDHILVLRERDFSIYSSTDFEPEIDTWELPDDFGSYEPVIYQQTYEQTPGQIVASYDYKVFLISERGDIYVINGTWADDGTPERPHPLQKIFTNTTEYLPTELALFAQGRIDVRLAFGLGNRAYLLGANGYLFPGFPTYLDQLTLAQGQHPKVLNLQDQIVLLYPATDQGYVALSETGELLPQNSLLYPCAQAFEDASKQDYLYYDELNQHLLWYYALKASEGSRAYIHSLTAAKNPILWAGFRNGESGTFYHYIDADTPPPDPVDFAAYVFPNPVKSGIFRLRVLGAGSTIKVNIFNIAGSKVYSNRIIWADPKQDIELDAARFSSGVYIVHVKGNRAQKTFKFTVEK
ncbi:MAG: T9SS type A sorting domain-containing protein [Candidatus Cloacimonetes bacterium]|jgi:M6 family metalloprotease-like protein|nr:T9SS type A sorting domain-containing protein [Candidatus Cloacimonadota bacterium]